MDATAQRGLSDRCTRTVAAVTRIVACAACAAVLLAGCAALQPPIEPVVLTLGTDDSPGVPSAEQILRFAREVAQRSGGGVTIEPRWHAEGDNDTDWDQAVAALVRTGELDLAVGPTWAWDVLDVHSLEPLQTPLLIDSDALAAAIVSDDALAADLMEGMADAGAVGISLWPEGLRHPFGFQHPLVEPADLDGEIIRSPLSTLSTRLFEALGATTTAADPDATTMAGSHAEYALGPNGTGTANITLFPKLNVLYAAAERYEKLDDRTRTVLAEAAAATRRWAVTRADDVAAGGELCADGGSLVEATPEQRAGWRAAVASVVDELRAAHGDTIAAIEAMKLRLPAAPHAAPCTTTAASTHALGKAESELNGTYRFTLTVAELLAGGLSASLARRNAGQQTFTLRDGSIHYDLEPSEAGGDTDSTDGTYQVDGQMLTTRFPAYDDEIDRFTFQVLPCGDLELTFVDSTDPAIETLMASKTWTRIDD